MKSSTINERVFNIVLYSFMILMGAITLYPFLNVLAISLNNSIDSVRGGIYLWPRMFTLQNYIEVFKYKTLTTGFYISVLRTVIGTVLGVLSSAMVAYAISCREFVIQKFVATIFILTMYFGGGMIPDYMLVRNLGLINNFWVYIWPGLLNGFNIFVLRAYIDTLPISLKESAKLDGANDLTIFFRIVFPLCVPVIATIALFVAVGHWNSWFDTFLYCGSNQNLTTLQFELQRIMADATLGSNNEMFYRTGTNALMNRVTPESIRMAITIIATVPIVVVYPFLQRYFVKGLTLGAVKS
ncbi:MAG: carbohydrate ABC transporter permease [Firmicutes bacterium]|nr:carbohydrate ABC transporter permease [Bacillota bacterium]